MIAFGRRDFGRSPSNIAGARGELLGLGWPTGHQPGWRIRSDVRAPVAAGAPL